MNFLNQLQKHKIVEVNKLVGLLSGHMVAQAKFETEDAFLDNGHILFLDLNGNLVMHGDADAATLGQPFLHYTEELMDGPVSGYEYFTVEVMDGVAYPRAIALYEGDEFTTNNIANLVGEGAFADWDNGEAWAVLDDGLLTLIDELPEAYEGPLFKAFKDRLPAGQVAARLVLLAKKVTIVEAGE